MKRLYLFNGIFIGVILCGCSTNKPQPIMKVENNIYPSAFHQVAPQKLASVAATPKQCALKNPIAITFYSEGKKPFLPYKVIAKESISQFNDGGIKRQEAVIHDVLRQLAASLGGDAVINVRVENQKISGEVIKFEV